MAFLLKAMAFNLAIDPCLLTSNDATTLGILRVNSVAELVGEGIWIGVLNVDQENALNSRRKVCGGKRRRTAKIIHLYTFRMNRNLNSI